MVNVGDVFELDGKKWSIKLIDLDGSSPKNKSGEPRIDASPFYTDNFGEEKLRKGRPSKFKPEAVYKALGKSIPDSFDKTIVEPHKYGFQPGGFTKISEDSEANVKPEPTWEEVRASREAVANLIGSIDDDSTEDDW